MVELDPEEATVTLETGEEMSAQVLIGADGEFGACRTLVLGKEVVGKPTGLAVYE